MTIKSRPPDFTVSIVAVARCAFVTWKNFTGNRSSLIARIQSGPCLHLEGYVKEFDLYLCENLSRGVSAPSPYDGGPVTVMTVALAITAAAKEYLTTFRRPLAG